MGRLAIVIVNYNTAALLRGCLAAIHAVTDVKGTEIIVVDNASVDNSAAMVSREFPEVRLLALSENLGFGVANNLGVATSSASYIMLLNSDAVLLEDTGVGLVRYLEEHDDVSCVGPRIVLSTGERQPRVFGNLPSLWRIAMQSLHLDLLFPRTSIFEGTDGRDRGHMESDVGWISGVCMVMRRADFLAVGGFDPGIFMYCEDVDLCSRLSERGGRIVRIDRFPVLHYGGASSPSMAAQVKNTVRQQRNLLRVVRGRSGRAASHAARLLLLTGLLLRIAAGLVLTPKRGVRSNLLLCSSWRRMVDLVLPVSLTTG
jgi:GT2 family glycosyltransferase